MKRIISHSIVLIVILLLQQQSGVSAFTSIVGVSNKIGLARYSSTPPGRRSRNIHHRINNINHRSASSSTTSLSAVSAVATTNLPSAAAISISTFYKASPLIAGFSIGLLCRMIQYAQYVNNNNSTDIKRRFSLRGRRSSNYALILCLVLVLGLLIEVLIHAGALVPTMLFSTTNGLARKVLQ